MKKLENKIIKLKKNKKNEIHKIGRRRGREEYESKIKTER